MLVALIDQPYLLRFNEIAALTPRQVQQYYHRRRDKEGKPIPFEQIRDEDTIAAAKARWFGIGRILLRAGKANFTEEELVRTWEASDAGKREAAAKKREEEACCPSLP